MSRQRTDAHEIILHDTWAAAIESRRTGATPAQAIDQFLFAVRAVPDPLVFAFLDDQSLSAEARSQVAAYRDASAESYEQQAIPETMSILHRTL